jgi:hypothetical protein
VEIKIPPACPSNTVRRTSKIMIKIKSKIKSKKLLAEFFVLWDEWEFILSVGLVLISKLAYNHQSSYK